MFEARNFKVFVNDRALICDSANVIEQNSLSPANILGKKNAFSQVANGPVTSNVKLDYTLSLDGSADDLLTLALLHQTGNIHNEFPSPVIIKLGSFSGSYLIDSYSLKVAPNGQIKPSCALTSYYATSGSMTENTQPITNYLSGDFAPNAFNAEFLNYNGSVTGINVYDLSYGVSFNYSPIYVLGQKEPKQVIFNEANESLSVLHDTFSHIDYSGQFNYINNLAALKIYSISKNINPSNPLIPYFSKTISLSGMAAKSTEITPRDDVVLNQTSFERSI